MYGDFLISGQPPGYFFICAVHGAVTSGVPPDVPVHRFSFSHREALMYVEIQISRMKTTSVIAHMADLASDLFGLRHLKAGVIFFCHD
jgi:hypothetical protein